MRSPRAATKSSPRSPQLEKACVQQRRPIAAKDKKINKYSIKKILYPAVSKVSDTQKPLIPLN